VSVIATKLKNVVMVRFPAPEKMENRHVSFDVVCYLRLTPTGELEVNYSHHVIRTREGNSGPFGEDKSRMPLDSSLIGLITIGTMQEFWSSMANVYRTLPGEFNIPISEVEF
jgi:hypothetical protein